MIKIHNNLNLQIKFNVVKQMVGNIIFLNNLYNICSRFINMLMFLVKLLKYNLHFLNTYHN